MTDSIGQYKLLDRIGSGAMGDLVRARDTRAGRTVALRIVPDAIRLDRARRAEFLADVRATATLSHPNIATIYEVDEHQGTLFVAGEYVPGQSLASLINGRALNSRRAVDLAIQLADALADAHSAGLVHRDLRSSGIIITPKGNAKILDFGLARWSDSGEARARASRMEESTSPDELAAVRYMSPEQIVGEASDERTDIFSLGIVLFEMLTGKLPFTGASSTDIAMQIAQAPTPSATALNPDLPPEVDVIVRKALSKSLDQRYESSATLAAELRSVAAILDVRAESAEPIVVPTPVRVRRGGGGDIWVMLLVGAVLVGVTYWQRDLAVTLTWRLLSMVMR